MAFDADFLKTFTEVLEDAKSRAPKTPLSVELATEWNERVFKQVAPKDAGVFRTSPRTVRWLDRDDDGTYYPVDIEAQPPATAATRVRTSYDNFERVLPGAVGGPGEIEKVLAWPVLATVDSQLFEIGNLLTAAICLNFMAKRAGLELARIDWADRDLRYRIYLGLRPGSSGGGALARYLHTRLGTQESPEGPEATHIADLDQVGQDGGHGGSGTPPNGRKHVGGGPRALRRASKRPPLPPPEVTDYP
jgi:hypothetical protein